MARFIDGMPRRRVLTVAAASTAIAATGCIGGADGEDGVYEFDAAPATVPQTALADAGYEGEDPEPFEIETEFDEFGIDAAVSVTTWTAVYANPDRAATLFVTSTPDATVLGQSVNPLVRADDAEVIRRLLDRASDDADVDEEEFEEHGSETRRILGEDVEIQTFETELDLDIGPEDIEGDVDDAEESDVDPHRYDTGEGTPVLVHVGTVEHGDDVVALVGLHPVAVEERDALFSLMENTEH